MKIVVATNNEHKLKEIREIVSLKEVKFLSLKDLNINIDIPETGATYFENSLQKATKIAEFTDLPIIADDSGITIDELGDNVPGIYSHRFAESHGGYLKCNEYLTKTVPNSPAHFTCHITLLNYKDFADQHFEGIINGKIANELSGTNGFGYDPIFIPDGYDKPIACYDEKIKNSISHRYEALRKLVEFLKNN